MSTAYKRLVAFLGIGLFVVSALFALSFFKIVSHTQELDERLRGFEERLETSFTEFVKKQESLLQESTEQRAPQREVVTRIEYRASESNSGKIDQIEDNQAQLRNRLEELGAYLSQETTDIKIEVIRVQDELSSEMDSNFERLGGYLSSLSQGDTITGGGARGQRAELVDTLVQSKLRAGHDAFNRRNFEEAAKLFKEALELAPNNRDAELYETISAYYSKRESDAQRRETKQKLQILLEEDPRNYKALEVLAEITGEEGAWEEAVALYRKWLINNEGTPEIFARAGYACFYNGMPAEAAAYFEQAIEREPTNSEYYIGAWKAYSTIGANEKAEEKYRVVLELEAENPAFLKSIEAWR